MSAPSARNAVRAIAANGDQWTPLTAHHHSQMGSKTYEELKKSGGSMPQVTIEGMLPQPAKQNIEIRPQLPPPPKRRNGVSLTARWRPKSIPPSTPTAACSLVDYPKMSCSTSPQILSKESVGEVTGRQEQQEQQQPSKEVLSIVEKGYETLAHATLSYLSRGKEVGMEQKKTKNEDENRRIHSQLEKCGSIHVVAEQNGSNQMQHTELNKKRTSITDSTSPGTDLDEAHLLNYEYIDAKELSAEMNLSSDPPSSWLRSWLPAGF